MYSLDRFSQSETQFQCADGSIRPARVYTYESQKALFDILIIENAKFVRTNCGSLSCFINDWKPAHYAIENHFKLGA